MRALPSPSVEYRPPARALTRLRGTPTLPPALGERVYQWNSHPGRVMQVRSSIIVALLFASVAGAQSPGEHIALGDSVYARFKPDEALPHYLAGIGPDSSNYEALWKAARSEIDLAEVERDEGRRDRYSRAGELLARRAIRVNPNDAEAHFHLARALGRRALSVGVRDRIQF